MEYGLLTFPTPKPDTSRKILHVDMDAFYANIEIRDDPSLKPHPVVIAKHPKKTYGRGIVTTCNYEARKFGIHSAMASQEAFERCPHAIFIPPNFDKYRQVSKQVRQIFSEYTDLIEPLSLDEAYLDVTHNKKKIKSAVFLAQEIQYQILNQVNLTCSIGVSYNKFLAKLASDFHKPLGITLVSPEEALVFLKQLPIEDFYGVGRKSLPSFHELDIYKGEDLYRFSLEELEQHFGKMGHSLYFKVRGIHDSPVVSHRQRKSIGSEKTFLDMYITTETVSSLVRPLVQKIITRLNELNLKARTITLKMRYDNFETQTRQSQVERGVSTVDECLNQVEALWELHGDSTRALRLIGVSLSNFIDPEGSVQLQLPIHQSIEPRKR